MALGQKEIGKRVLDYTSGLANSASDLMLFAIRYNLDLGGSESPITEIGFASFKRSLIHLKSKKLITESSGTTTGFILTDLGLAELEKISPSYKDQRDWTGKIYLINYDLPVTKNTIRNSFRDFLKSIGCGMLQHSLWLTPYDPREKLLNYINENQLPRELVIVSSLNLEVELYPYQIPNLIEETFKLSKINQRYQEYINMVTQEGVNVPREKKIFEFLNILHSDPQVPYDLIPAEWAGYQAHEIFKSLA